MKYYKKMESENVYLAPLRVEDAEKFCEWMNDKSVTEGINATKDVMTLEGEKKYLEDAINGDGLFFSIVKKESDELIGSCSIVNIDYMAGRGELGIIIGDKSSRGKGYGKEVMKMLLNFGFNSLNFHSMNLTVYPFNKNAIACYEKVGFKMMGKKREAAYHDGKYCDILIMDILKDEYEELK